MKPANAHNFGLQLTKILGIENMTDVTISLNWNKDCLIKANVEFLLDDEQVKEILTLFQDGTWRKDDAV